MQRRARCGGSVLGAVAARWRPASALTAVRTSARATPPTTTCTRSMRREGLRWNRTTGAAVQTTPAIVQSPAGAVVYVGVYNFDQYALNASTCVVWIFATGGTVGSPNIGVDGTIYVSSADYNLYALTASGTLWWNHSFGSPAGSTQALSADGTTVFVSFGTAVYALETSSGALLWSRMIGSSLTDPAVATGNTVFVGSTRYIYALSGSTGAPVWCTRPRAAG